MKTTENFDLLSNKSLDEYKERIQDIKRQNEIMRVSVTHLQQENERLNVIVLFSSLVIIYLCRGRTIAF